MNNKKIAEDLLNLYAEDLLNEDSKAFVEENLKNSNDLREKLNQIKNDQLKIGSKKLTLDFVSKTVKKDKKSYALMVTSLVVSLLLICFSFLTRPIHYEDDGNLYRISKTDNEIFISFTKDVIKVDTYQDGGEIFLDAYTSLLDQILNKSSKQVVSFEKDPDRRIYYDNQEKKASLIYGNASENVQLLPRLALNSYLILISIISGILIILAIFLKKFRKFIKYIILVPITYLLAYICVCGFNFYSFYLERDLIYIVFLWLSLYLFSLSLISLVVDKKNKKI
ncbi:MAG: hypothetical protein PUG67_01705 [Peptoniphilaceae bacterium]|nr:hypothetical protein [Peptoniphilaceae bacterium]MDY6019712.1 hypothetical protein [Anaerococcus sp.]